MATGLMDPKRLGRLATLGFEKMSSFRKARMQMLKQYVSRFYGAPELMGWSENRAAPINLIYQAVTTFVPNLAYANPKARVTSHFVAYKGYASIAELAINHLVQEIRFRDTLRKIITDAIFMAGFVKLGIGVTGQTLDIDGFLADVGQVYGDRVDPDDMVLDPVARQWEEQRAIGNRFRADLATLQDSGLYDPDQLAKYSSRYSVGRLQDSAEGLSGDAQKHEADELAPAIDLVEMWVPSENVVVTLPWTPGNEVAGEALRVAEYEGREEGPYEMLGFAFVPDNILPVAPAMIWYDLHMLANRVARKAARQAERQKSILAYESSSWQDAQEIVDSQDGESVRVDNIDGIKEVSYGGAADDGYKFIQWAKAAFSEMAMNVDLLSGVGSNEPTAAQAEMVQANASVRLGDMQSIVYNFCEQAMRAMFFFLHTDPLIELPLVKRVAGVDQQVSYTPEMREGDWLDYNIQVRPYSMSRQEPNLKVRRLLEFFGNVVPAVANAFQMMGPAINVENAFNLIGLEMGIEELAEIINSPALHMQLQRMQELLEQGVPLDPKIIQTILRSQVGPAVASTAQSAGPAGVRPVQPNPLAALPSGIGPGREANARHQEMGAELQRF